MQDAAEYRGCLYLYPCVFAKMLNMLHLTEDRLTSNFNHESCSLSTMVACFSSLNETSRKKKNNNTNNNLELRGSSRTAAFCKQQPVSIHFPFWWHLPSDEFGVQTSKYSVCRCIRALHRHQLLHQRMVQGWLRCLEHRRKMRL